MKTSDEIKTDMAQRGARDALVELRHLFTEAALTLSYGPIYQEDVMPVLLSGADLTSLLNRLVGDLPAKPQDHRAVRESDAVTLTPPESSTSDIPMPGGDDLGAEMGGAA